MKLLDKTWRGLRHTPGSICSPDGTWTPAVILSLAFRSEDFKGVADGHPPDLCTKCMAKALRGFADKLDASPRT